MCTVNVGTVLDRSGELVEMLARRRVEVCCAQDTSYRGEESRIFKHGENQYKFWWSGNSNEAGGVCVLVKRSLEEDVAEVERISGRIMKVKMVLGGRIVQILSVYAPQVGLTNPRKEEFWGTLEDVVSEIPETQGLIIMLN